MSLALAVKHLLACGASNEAVVRFIEEAESASKTRERDRKRAYRERLSQDGRDNGTTPPLSPPMINNSTPPIPSPDLANAKSVKSPFPESLFEDFWSVYPRKVGKGEAKKAFRNALKRATAEEIVAGAKRYAASKPDPEYTKHPGPWLNADRWLDEPERKPGAVLAGPWKPVAPEPERPKISEEERARNLAKLTGIVSSSLKWNGPQR
jgi:hypothetical protein